jgi:uncharacterized protein (UPF0305 family)
MIRPKTGLNLSSSIFTISVWQDTISKSQNFFCYWVQNVNARNEYLRELKAAKWDTFLNVDRLDHDKKQKYAETEKMLADVRKASDQYQSEYEKIHKTFLAKIQELSVDKEMRQILEMKLGAQQKPIKTMQFL